MGATVHSPIFVNALGHLAGVIAFTAFLILLARGARQGGPTRLWAPVGAAALAVLWNLGSLVVLLSDPNSPSREVVASLSFSVLSLLPGLLLHLALGAEYRWLRAVGYLTASVAAGLHLTEAVGGSIGSHALGIDLITYGFGGLAIVFVFLLIRSRADRRRAAMRASAATSLFLLAASFLHFEVEPGPVSWTHELLFHHAAIPLALFVLLQDHRFLLLDAFVRWLGSALLAGAFSGLLLGAAWQLKWLGVQAAGSVGLATFGVAIALAILLYPGIRDWIGDRIEPFLFRRGDEEAALRRLRSLDNAGECPAVEEAARVLAEFISTQLWSLSDIEEPVAGFAAEPLDGRTSPHRPSSCLWAEVVVALRVSPGRCRLLWLGPRAGGRRYLGADIEDLRRLAAEAAARLEVLRRDEQKRLLAEAELQALRTQMNPHFLFNALNALYGAIPRAAPGARRTLLNLVDILRYSLDGRRQYVDLEEELRVVEAYLAIERLRLQDRLSVRIECTEEARNVKIPAFTIQPLVENAVKHGIGQSAKGGTVLVDVRLEADKLCVCVEDNGVGFDSHSPTESGHGLPNVRRRLELCYGDESEFEIESSNEGTQVRFRVPFTASVHGALAG